MNANVVRSTTLSRDEGHDELSQIDALAAAVEMQTSLDACGRLEDAADTATRCLAKLLQAEGVVLLWRNHPNAGLRWLSDYAGKGRLCPAEDREVIAAGEEASLHDAMVRTDSSVDNATPTTMAMRQWLRSVGGKHLIACPLMDSTRQNHGVLLALDSRSASAEAMLDAFTPLLISKLQSIQRLQPQGIDLSIVRGIRIVRATWRRAAGYAFAAVALLMFMPATHTIRTSMQLQPVQRRFIAVPFDGPLQRCLVRPGDSVEKGDLLAVIDPRELDYELAGVRALYGQADQERKGSMATHDVGGNQLATLETDRLRLQTDLLTHRKDNLEIRSPIDGMIVSGDWKQSEGAPLSRGETMFEIAPVGAMKIEITVPEQDFSHVRPGMPVRVHTHAMPDRVMTGTIDRISPRASTREGQNVFIAEVHVKDDAGLLRPGMAGRATIYGERHSIGWIVLHRPWHLMMRWWGI